MKWLILLLLIIPSTLAFQIPSVDTAIALGTSNYYPASERNGTTTQNIITVFRPILTSTTGSSGGGIGGFVKLNVSIYDKNKGQGQTVKFNITIKNTEKTLSNSIIRYYLESPNGTRIRVNETIQTINTGITTFQRTERLPLGAKIGGWRVKAELIPYKSRVISGEDKLRVYFGYWWVIILALIIYYANKRRKQKREKRNIVDVVIDNAISPSK